MKSPPELWAECSDATSLSRHLNDCFGEIRITRLEPETAVAWEGEHGSGTVRLEPSGWGTRVILTARARGAAEDRPAPEPQSPAAPPLVAPDASPPPAAPPLVAPDASPPPAAPPPAAPVLPAASPGARRPARQGLFGRLLSRYRTAPPPAPFLVAPPLPAAPPEPPRPLAFEPSFVAPDGAAAEPGSGPAPAAVPPPAPAVDPAELAAEDSDAPECAAPDPAADQVAEDSDAPESAAPDPAAALIAALDSLGQAHHRPFSRA